MATDDRGNGRNGGLFSGLDIKERLIAALMAVILGGGGAASYMGIKPPRPDPWTGAMDRQRMEEYDRAMRREIEQRFKPFSDHLIQATDGWARIYTMQEKIGHCEDSIQQLQADVRQLFREKGQ